MYCNARYTWYMSESSLVGFSLVDRDGKKETYIMGEQRRLYRIFDTAIRKHVLPSDNSIETTQCHYRRKNKLEIKDTCCKIRSIEMLGLTIKSVCSSPVSLKCGILEKRSGARRWLLVMTGTGETSEIYMVFIGMNH